MLKIQNILIINLDERKDLLKKIQYVFNLIKEKYKDIKIERIEGVNLREDIKKDKLLFNEYLKNNIIGINANGLRNNKESLIGEIGCYLGHKRCWEKILENKLENILILEDGIIFDEDIFDNNINRYNKNYDIIFVNKEMKKNGNMLYGYGLQGYILSKNGAKKLLNLCRTMIMPIDLQIRNLCNENKLIWEIYDKPLVERNNKRMSSISKDILNNTEIDLNKKQNLEPIIIRIFKNLLLKNIPLYDYL